MATPSASSRPAELLDLRILDEWVAPEDLMAVARARAADSPARQRRRRRARTRHQLRRRRPPPLLNDRGCAPRTRLPIGPEDIGRQRLLRLAAPPLRLRPVVRHRP